MALIYIVEDDENIREIEAIALKNSNYLVKSFARASEFYRAMDDILPDLVLLDVMLPDESGYEIVKRLRSQSQTRHLPVIMVTRSETAIISLSLWVMNRMDLPSLAKPRMISMSSSISWGVRTAVGSSKIRISLSR